MVTENTLISELVKKETMAAAILEQEGFHCLSCASFEGETVESAARSHGIDPVILIRKLNLRLYGKLA